MTEFKIEEISAVDKPAQKGAKATIMKRDDQPEKELTANIGKTETAKKETEMAEENKANEVVKNLEAELAKAQTLAKMSDAEKAYMNGMSDKEKETFMSSDEDTRKKMMDKTKKNDSTVEVEGKTIAKSEVGDKAFEAYEKMADIEKRLAATEKEAQFSKFAKQAADEYPNVVGTDDELAELLMALSTLDNEVAKSTLGKILKAANEANAGDFEKRGVSGEASEKTVMGKVDEKVTEIMKRDSISKADATVKVWDENPELYDEYEKEVA